MACSEALMKLDADVAEACCKCMGSLALSQPICWCVCGVCIHVDARSLT